ncbi:SIMPL domain-containing protein [Gordonia westfalica]|uniref:SIMPL domain-containing protein n=1 Tax=Gordonia westfalica TaxID=158898 RepID=A0A1H2JL00_9ACTN|nr:SIMPL domain-containing protein [Gordonia westfalica]SDU56841.1 hypothetical protein SAMN04488548_1342226 [Gordonia westfalica]
MTDLEIVVRGNARGRYAPERGVLDLAVHLEGPVKSAVYEAAVALHSRLTGALGELESAGAVNRWTAESVRVYSYRPYSQDGEPRDPMYNTRIRLDAEFGDFEKLSEFIDTWSGEEGVTVNAVRWDVHETSRRAHERELRREAVEDAIAKAQAYSDAVGRGPVTPTLLSDPDMVDRVPSPRGRMMIAAAPDSGPSLELRADDIEIDVAVDARFRAE